MDEAMHPLAMLWWACTARRCRIRTARPAPGGAVEVRIQEHQIHHQDHLRGEAAGDHLEHLSPHEYGFYSNVNPEVDHPRWSQATERRLGELTERKTLKFNGYDDQVAGLYASLDLRKNY